MRECSLPVNISAIPLLQRVSREMVEGVMKECAVLFYDDAYRALLKAIQACLAWAMYPRHQTGLTCFGAKT